MAEGAFRRRNGLLVVAALALTSSCGDSAETADLIADAPPGDEAPVTTAASTTTTVSDALADIDHASEAEPAEEEFELSPHECDVSWLVPAALDSDDLDDWIAVTSEPGAIPTRVAVCSSMWGIRVFDVDAPVDTVSVADPAGIGQDTLLLIGGTSDNTLMLEVWSVVSSSITGDRLMYANPAIVPDGSPLAVSRSAFVDDSGRDGMWFGCSDLDGDGRHALAAGTWRVEQGDPAMLMWTGIEYEIIGADDRAEATPGPMISGSVPVDAPEEWSAALPADGCPAGSDFGPDPSARPCAESPPLPVTPTGQVPVLGDVTPVLDSDLLISDGVAVHVIRDSQVVGQAATGDHHRAFHDLDGGLVIGQTAGSFAHVPGSASKLVHLRADGSATTLVSAGVDESFRLEGVGLIDGVATAYAVRREGLEEAATGDLTLVPLDGSPVRSLPALEYYEGGTMRAMWTGDYFVMVEGGEGISWVRVMDAAGVDIEVPWNRWSEPASWWPSLTYGPGKGAIWVAAPTPSGDADIQSIDAYTGATLISWSTPVVDPYGHMTVDSHGDQLVLIVDGCVRIHDQAGTDFVELSGISAWQ